MADTLSSNILLTQFLEDAVSKSGNSVSPLFRVLSDRGCIKAGRGYGLHGEHDGYQTGASNYDEMGDLATFSITTKVAWTMPWARFYEARAISNDVIDGGASNNSPADFTDAVRYELGRAVENICLGINKQLFTGTGTSSSLVGLETAVSQTATYASIVRASHAGWRSVERVSQGALTTAMIRAGLSAVQFNAPSRGKRPNLIVTTPEIFDKLCSIGEGMVQLQVPVERLASMGLNIGFDYIMFQGIPVLADQNCPSGKMFLVNTDVVDVRYLPAAEGIMVQADDGKGALGLPVKFQPLPTTKDGKQFAVTSRLLMMVREPAACGVLTGITV